MPSIVGSPARATVSRCAANVRANAAGEERSRFLSSRPIRSPARTAVVPGTRASAVGVGHEQRVPGALVVGVGDLDVARHPPREAPAAVRLP